MHLWLARLLRYSTLLSAASIARNELLTVENIQPGCSEYANRTSSLRLLDFTSCSASRIAISSLAQLRCLSIACTLLIGFISEFLQLHELRMATSNSADNLFIATCY